MSASRFAVRLLTALIVGLLGGCASAPVLPPPPAPPPELPFESKMGWILRLEEDRLLQSPEAPPPPAPPPVVPAGGRGRTPAVAAPAPLPPPHPSLLTLLTDREARIRRRAALAVGR